jgi:hypothetical protein
MTDIRREIRNDRVNNDSIIFQEDEYNGDEKRLFNKYKLLNYDILVVGSYSLASQRYAADIDSMSLITGRKEWKKVNEQIKLICRDIEIDNDIFFLEFKIQYNDGTKIKFYQYDEVDIPEKNFNKIYYLKLDSIVFINGVFKEFSINYYFKYPDDLIGDMKKDIKQFNSEGLYLKSIKRNFSIAKLKNDKVTAKLITVFLNSRTGKNYELYNNLQTIITLLENYGDDIKVRDKVRVILNFLGIKPFVSVINDKIKILSKQVNADAKLFLDKLHNKKNII